MKGVADISCLNASAPWGRSGGRRQRRSLSSCWRMGILSMVWDSSRTVQGTGLRSLMPPSLPISTMPNPLGRSVRRMSDLASGSVSTSTTTSRSSNAGRSAFSRSICRIKAGSAGLSAKTAKGRWVHLNCESSAVFPSRMMASVMSVSCAETAGLVSDNNIMKMAASRVMAPPVALEIGAMPPNSKLFSAEMSQDGRPASIGGMT